VPTLKDIARECNVSFSTVSKALKGSPDIGAKTVRLVQETAKRMGYHPNISARALRTNRTYDIGVIFEDKTGTGLQHQFFAKVFDGLNVKTHSRGYDITFIDDSISNHKNYYDHAVYRSCDGVAIVYTDFSRPDIMKLIASTIPTVTMDYIYDKNHTAILSDNETGMTQLTEYAILQGHRRIALIQGEDTFVTQKRKKAFFSVLEQHHISIPDEYVRQGQYHNPDLCGKETRKLLELQKRPTCILFPDDYSSMGGLNVLEQNHIKPGKDISVAGYDGLMLSSLLNPPLTTYHQNGEELGRQMAEQLINQIENERYVPHVVEISGKLIRGNSLRKILDT
jgi:LacI family transcriptional regulator